MRRSARAALAAAALLLAVPLQASAGKAPGGSTAFTVTSVDCGAYTASGNAFIQPRVFWTGTDPFSFRILLKDVVTPLLAWQDVSASSKRYDNLGVAFARDLVYGYQVKFEFRDRKGVAVGASGWSAVCPDFTL